MEAILLDAAILNASPTSDNNHDVYYNLAAVCRLWRKIIEGDVFRDEFIRRLVTVCKQNIACLLLKSQMDGLADGRRDG